MLMLLKLYWRWLALAAGVLLVAGLWLYADHQRHVAQAQKAKAQVAVRQDQVQVVATHAVDHVATTTQAVEEHTRVVVRTIQAAPGSDTPVPAELLVAWRAGLRDDADPPN